MIRPSASLGPSVPVPTVFVFAFVHSYPSLPVNVVHRS